MTSNNFRSEATPTIHIKKQKKGYSEGKRLFRRIPHLIPGLELKRNNYEEQRIFCHRWITTTPQEIVVGAGKQLYFQLKTTDT